MARGYWSGTHLPPQVHDRCLIRASGGLIQVASLPSINKIYLTSYCCVRATNNRRCISHRRTFARPRSPSTPTVNGCLVGSSLSRRTVGIR
jgi:hypothetical protein